ncbi:MAG: hypothetical protein JW954_07655 [Dehalococcoidaceae bacterium]|nr:hypothetical protein [Dehalococcoidaceae bacterium]
MTTLCLLFNLLGLTVGLTGILTVFNIFPGFIHEAGSLSPELATAVFWWALSVILILAGMAFGIYQTAENGR